MLFKYAGNKTRLLPFYDDIMSKGNYENFSNAYELFGGSGALTLHLKENHPNFTKGLFHYNDRAFDLVKVHSNIKTHHDLVVETILPLYEDWNARGTDELKKNLYYRLRNEYRALSDKERQDPKSGGVLLFLLQMNYSGILVLKDDKYFTPCGQTKNVNIERRLLGIKKHNYSMSQVSLSCDSYKNVFINNGSFVFLDPPYVDSNVCYGEGKKAVDQLGTDAILRYASDLAGKTKSVVWMSNHESVHSTMKFDKDNTFGADIYRKDIVYTLARGAKKTASQEVLLVWDGR